MNPLRLIYLPLPSRPPYIFFAFFSASLIAGLNANQPISLHIFGT